MAFALKKEESVAQGIARIVEKESREVLACLTAKGGSRKEQFHQARKRLKKIRATLRLIRDEIGESDFARENAAFRDVARRLSAVRDAQVLPETLDDLLDHYKDAVSPAQFQPVREVLATFSREIVDESLGDKNDTRQAVREMRQAIARIGEYGIGHDGWKALRGGLKATYAQSRARYLAAYDSRSDADFHEWRKSVKYLRHHVDLLARCWEKPLENLSDQLHALSDLLGQDHDLAVMRDQLAAHVPEDESEMWRALFALIEQRQAELRADAEPLSRRLFAEKPGAFTRRLREYWDAWHQPAASPEDHFAVHA